MSQTDFNAIITAYKNVLIQIATQQSTGTGFYLAQWQLIVTNSHVVGEAAEVSIQGKLFSRQLARVLLKDDKYDLAFVQAPAEIEFPMVALGANTTLHDGDAVLA
ncbi:MAG: serine protease, partial [Chitinophagaceae bacterium]|nr:serine protease [Chitinophagaceae bacterium]